jgi:cytochrome c biogenesis protein CcmG, thiol:disulfide interchange protein DsbE
VSETPLTPGQPSPSQVSRGRRLRLIGQGIALGLVALLFLLLVWALVTEEGGDLAAAANRGDRPEAPEFALERLDGEGDLALSSLEGKAVVLNFWASWCLPCKDEAPFLETLWQENRDRGLVVVGLDAKDFRRDARSFAERFGLTFPLVFDGPGETLGGFGVTGFPETFVLDREGRVVQAFLGDVSSDDEKQELRAAIDRALEQA